MKLSLKRGVGYRVKFLYTTKTENLLAPFIIGRFYLLRYFAIVIGIPASETSVTVL